MMTYDFLVWWLPTTHAETVVGGGKNLNHQFYPSFDLLAAFLPFFTVFVRICHLEKRKVHQPPLRFYTAVQSA